MKKLIEAFLLSFLFSCANQTGTTAPSEKKIDTSGRSPDAPLAYVFSNSAMSITFQNNFMSGKGYPAVVTFPDGGQCYCFASFGGPDMNYAMKLNWCSFWTSPATALQCGSSQSSGTYTQETLSLCNDLHPENCQELKR